MLTIVQAYIQTHQLLAKDQTVVVGLSGGADSVALLAVLVRLGYTCVAAHCNFHLRGKESDRDEQFAAEFARQSGVAFHRTDFDTQQYAIDNHLSIEMAARELRYAWFETLRLSVAAQAVAVAHHRDDSVETMLMNLVRGTGIRGMCGIRPRNGCVVRPLLCVGKDEIVDWLVGMQLPYVTDSTNLSDEYTRNFIRLRVLPLLEEVNPSVRLAMARTVDHLSAVETVYLRAVEDARAVVMKTPGRLSINDLMRYPEPASLLYELLLPYGVTRVLARDIFVSLPKESGKEFFTPTHRLVKDRDEVLIVPVGKEEKRSYRLDIAAGSCTEPIGLSFYTVDVTASFRIEKDKNTACFDYDKLRFPLCIRRWEEGDRFVPFGMSGSKKLSDYFNDHKYSLLQKEKTWLLCSGDDILWMIGERADNRFRIEKNTKQALVVKIFG